MWTQYLILQLYFTRISSFVILNRPIRFFHLLYFPCQVSRIKPCHASNQQWTTMALFPVKLTVGSE